MTITTTWDVLNLKRTTNDGYVYSGDPDTLTIFAVDLVRGYEIETEIKSIEDLKEFITRHSGSRDAIIHVSESN